MVEHLPLKEVVGGSSPPRLTKIISLLFSNELLRKQRIFKAFNRRIVIDNRLDKYIDN